MTYQVRRDLAVSARIPASLRDRVEKAGRAVAAARGQRHPPSFNTVINEALLEWLEVREIDAEAFVLATEPM